MVLCEFFCDESDRLTLISEARKPGICGKKVGVLAWNELRPE